MRKLLYLLFTLLFVACGNAIQKSANAAPVDSDSICMVDSVEEWVEPDYVEEEEYSTDNNYSIQGATYEESAPNEYSSTSSNNPSINSGSVQSNQNNYTEFYYYKETSYCVEGVVVYEGENDYYIIETKRGYTILERFSGNFYEGNRIRGELNQYGMKYLINRSSNTEVKGYIEDFALSGDDAIEWMGEHEHLKRRDQEAYDNRN